MASSRSNANNGVDNGHDDFSQIMARLGIGDPAEILAIILEDAGPEWFRPGALAILAHFRNDPVMWGRIRTTAALRNIFPPTLDEAVDTYIQQHLPDKLRQLDTPSPKVAHVITLSTVEPTDVQWLWEPYIPLRKLTLLEGDPGLGKTWLCLQISACLSQGWAFPDTEGLPRTSQGPGRVLYLSAEDGLSDTLRPRLDDAGADCTRVHALVGWKMREEEEGAETGAITLGDIDLIEEAIALYRPALVVIDPLQGYLGSGIDMHRSNETRPILAKLSRVAEQYDCAILGIRHLSKSSQLRAIYRGLGSIDFAAAARSILLVGQDPESPDGNHKRVLAHVKSSLAPLGPSLGFELRDDQFFWTGLTTTTADDLLVPLKPNSAALREEEQGALEQAVEFLEEILKDDPVTGRDVERCARLEGISLRTLNRAKKELGVKSRKRTVDSGIQKRAYWEWSLPEEEEVEQDCQEA